MTRVYKFSIKGRSAEETRRALDLLDGVIHTLVKSDTEIEITWKANSDPLEKVANILQSGNYADGILLLELFRSNDPEDPDTLFNLGMAYSDRGELTRSIELLQKLIEKEPRHTNGRVALGVALLRARKTEEGIKELQTAVTQKPDNIWARRNLGAGLMQAGRFTEAVEHLRRATELNSTDQAAWFGYGQALQFSGETTEADKAFVKTIELDVFSQLAERAREARTELAEKSFRSDTKTPRMDAVMYCLAALEKFEKLPLK